MLSNHKGRWYLAAVIWACLATCFAQNEPAQTPESSDSSCEQGDSLAAAARCSKARKGARSKKVVTDEDIEAHFGPFPRLKMNEAENGEEVVAAIAKYKETHTPQETEDAIRGWYEDYDEELAAAITDNQDLQALREANVTNGYDLCQEGRDYQKCERRRIAEIHGARHDQVEIRHNTEWITRIQHSLMNIRSRLFQMGLRYEWFKIRTTNNIDRF